MPQKPGKYPDVTSRAGAGVRPYSGDVHMASKGVITLEIGIHGIPVTMSQMIYDVLSKERLTGILIKMIIAGIRVIISVFSQVLFVRSIL
mgnify:CR=1 FL=1